MATMPPTYHPLGLKTRKDKRRDYDAQRRAAKPWRAWYSLKVWTEIRSHQLAKEPLCRRHLARGETVAATVCNHVEPHRGDWQKFISGPFESLCKACHDSEVQREERSARR